MNNKIIKSRLRHSLGNCRSTGRTTYRMYDTVLNNLF